MTKKNQAWLQHIALLVSSERYQQLDLELAVVADDYNRLAEKLDELIFRLKYSVDALDADIEEMQQLLNEVDEKGSIVDLCDALRGQARVDDLPRERSQLIVWPHGHMWFRAVEARAVFERAENVRARISFDESILPLGFPEDLMEVRITVKNQIWEIHKTDADPLPSRPHAHQGPRTKLDLRNGDLYNKATFSNHKLGRKELERIRSLFEAKGVKMPELNYSTSKLAD